MIISVTQQQIDAPEPHCPLERAFISEGINAAVTGHDVAFFAVSRPAGETPISECLVCLPLPDRAKEFVNDFDNGRPVAPFSFDFEIPGEILDAARLA